MGRIRTLKPEFFRSRSLARCCVAARLTFAGLWCEADDFGRGVADPRIVKGAIWPLEDDVTHDHVAQHLVELEATDHIVIYEVDGERFFEIVHWSEHQSAAYRRGKAQFPAPPAVQERAACTPERAACTPTPTTGAAPPEDLHDEECKNVQLARSGVLEGKGREGNGEGNGIAPAARSRDLIWESIIDCWNIDPAELTDTERARLNKAAKLLRDVDADPAEIPRRRAIYRSRYRDAADTPMAIAGRWSELRRTDTGEPPKLPAGSDMTARNLARITGEAV